MKSITIILLAVVALSHANLQDDLKDFQKLIPKVKIGLIVSKHFIFDWEFRNFKNFVQSSEFRRNMNILEDNDKVRAVMNYVQESGLDNSAAKKNIMLMMEEEIKFSKYYNIKDMIMPRSVMSFIDEVVGAFSKRDVTNMMKHKIENSPDFKYFHERLTDDAFYQLISEARNDPEVAEIEKLFRSKGLNIDRVINIVKNVLKWTN